MRKLGSVAAVAATTLLAGCGGSTTTVIESTTVTATVPGSGGSGSGATTSAQGSATGSAPAVAGLPGTAAAASCFTKAGAAVRVRPAGQGPAVYAVTRDSGNIGMLKGPNANTAARIAEVFAGGGWKTSPVKGDSTAYSMYQGTLTQADSALLAKCVK